MKTEKLFLCLTVLFFMLCGSGAKSQNKGFDLSGYQLVFYDEFNDTVVNWNKWTLGEPWVNSPNNPYLNVKQNCIEGGGHIRFRGDQKGSDGKYHTGGITSVQKFSFGYYEARFKIPKGQGMWPAFWLLNWYNNPEIDIMENLGDNTTVMYCTLQQLSPGGQYHTPNGMVDYSSGYHVFGCAWFPDSIIMYIDSSRFCKWSKSKNSSWPNWNTSATMNVILNLQVGGSWGGMPDNTTPFPGYYDVDYVRVYTPKQATGTAVLPSLENAIQVYPNPFSEYLNVNISSEVALKNAVMKMYDLCGKEVKTVSINNHVTIIHRKDLQSGIYFYSIINDNKQIDNGKLIVQ